MSRGCHEAGGFALSCLAIAMSQTVQAADMQVSTPPATNQAAETATLPELTIRAAPYNAYVAPDATTATKTETPLMETPFSVQVITQQVLQDQQATTFDQALKNISGSYPYNAAENLVGGGITVLRGFSVTDYYRDGVAIPASVNPARREMANVERIEVLKGPSSILYGRIDPGGVINAITKQPSAASSYLIQQQVGSFSLKRTTIDATGPIGQEGNLLYRLNFAYHDTGSFVKFEGDTHTFIAPSFLWNISDATAVTLYVDYLKDKKTPTYGLPAIGTGNRPVDLPIDWTRLDPWNKVDSESTQTGLGLSHRFNNRWKLDAKVNTFHIAEQRLLQYGATVNPITYMLTRGVSDSADVADNQFASSFLTGKGEWFGINQTVLLGIDYANFKKTSRVNSNAYTALNIFAPVYTTLPFVRNPALDVYSGVKKSATGVSVQDDISLLNGFHLLFGGRQDRIELTQTGTFGIRQAQVNAFKPRAGLLWQASPGLSIYGSYSESMGTFGGSSDSTLVNPDGTQLQPESAKQREVGIKSETLDGQLTVGLAWFQINKKNISTPDPNPTRATLGYMVSVGEAQSKGIEFDLTAMVGNHWNIITSYAHTVTQILMDNSGNAGHQLPNVPRDGSSLWAVYRFGDDANGWKVGGGMLAQSQRQADLANSLQLPGFAIVNLMAGYQQKVGNSKLTAQINLENVFDRKYFQWAASRNNNYYGAPRAVTATVKLSF